MPEAVTWMRSSATGTGMQSAQIARQRLPQRRQAAHVRIPRLAIPQRLHRRLPRNRRAGLIGFTEAQEVHIGRVEREACDFDNLGTWNDRKIHAVHMGILEQNKAAASTLASTRPDVNRSGPSDARDA